MHQDSSLVGVLAVSCFLLFTGVGAVAQVHKLAKRTQAWKKGKLTQESICEGLHPVREMWSFSAFLLFALSGLTRSYIDLFLLISRIPVILLSTVILWFLQRYQGGSARRYYYIAVLADCTLLVVMLVVALGSSLNDTIVSSVVDGALSIVSFLLFYGKLSQAVKMYRFRQSRAVSWLREGGLIVKDTTGLLYSISIGPELFWVSVTHVLSAISSSTICIAKFLVERGRKEVERAPKDSG